MEDTFTYQSIKDLLSQNIEDTWGKVSKILDNITDEEFNKIPVVLMAKVGKEIIERYGIVVRPMHKDENVYSLGYYIIRIKIE